MMNLGIPLAPLRRARRKESVDTEWARIGVVTKKFCAKRATDFQKVLAPPPSSNGHGTGGVGTAIESPTFSNRPQLWGCPELAGKSCFPTEVRPKLPKLPARNSPSFLHQIDRAIEICGIHHRAIQILRITTGDSAEISAEV
ncbi:serine carboxypeptidase-like 40 [Prunus dulcis]|uniref:Serine carboxypeptidase-like 40 n=1 Tax=Prunus dulcis TaxID=3755 RepID=A0A4Y1RZJ5_PRUDU|nr:serine carboxypeptidase-like 40 [Prunus dulcis]